MPGPAIRDKNPKKTVYPHPVLTLLKGGKDKESDRIESANNPTREKPDEQTPQPSNQNIVFDALIDLADFVGKFPEAWLIIQNGWRQFRRIRL